MKKSKMLMAYLLCFFIAVAVLFVFGGCAEKPTEKEYTISFTDVRGNELSAVTVKEGEIPVFEGDFPTLPAETNVKAYSWKWNKEIVAATENTTYQLVLVETDKYAVKFMNGNAEIGSTQYVVAGGKATAPADPTKDATSEFTYAFDGWYTEAEGGEKVTDFTVKGEATYYARFVSITRKYKVKFMDGAEQVGETQTVAYGTAATAPADPTKDATAEFTYTFDGWYTTADGGEKVTDFTVKGEVTYYARFVSTTRKYEVKFMDGAEQVGETQTVAYGTAATAPADPTKDVTAEFTYTFDGWYSAAEGGEKVTDFTVKGEATYYARFVSTTRKYEVKFMNGAEQVGKTQTVAYGTAATVPADPTKDATAEFTYTFDGWYTAAEGGEKVTDFTVKGEATFYAQFTATKNRYTVTFISNGTTIQTESLEYGSPIVAPSDPIPETGYLFIGWEPVVAEVVTEDVSYTAKFAKILTQKDTASFKTILAENPNGDYVLGSDLDFEGANLADSTIIEFSGTFNGNGYALKNFVIEWYDPGDSGNWNSFVVSVNSGTIKNLAIYYKIVNINGGTAFIVDNVGTIDNCYFDVTFTDAAERTAPIAEINRGTISHCVVNLHDGGLGEKSTSVGLGGLVSSDYNGTFAYCYVAKNGISLDATHDMYKITWGNGSYSELHSYDSLNALANADFSAEGWNQELWEVKSGVLLFGEAIEKTQVLTQADAANFKTILAKNPNGDYVLASDIDFEGKILVGAIKFAGTIDGRGFALKNFSLNFNDGSDNGYNAYLFESNAGKIINLRIKMTIAASNNNKATLILTNTGILENIYVEFTLAQTYVQYTRVAPLVYDNVGTGRIRNCIVKVSLAEGVTIFDAENKNDFAAAVAVYNKDGGTMEHCYAVGDTNIPAVLYGWATQSNIASFASLAECSANVDFAPTNGWNSDYKEIIFSEVIAAKTLD